MTTRVPTGADATRRHHPARDRTQCQRRATLVAALFRPPRKRPAVTTQRATATPRADNMLKARSPYAARRDRHFRTGGANVHARVVAHRRRRALFACLMYVV